MSGDFVPMFRKPGNFAILFSSSWFDSFWFSKNLPSFVFRLVLIPQEFYQKIVSALSNPSPTGGSTAQQSARTRNPAPSQSEQSKVNIDEPESFPKYTQRQSINVNLYT